MQFIDLQAQRLRIEDKINSAVRKVLEEGRYVMGPEVAVFEKQLAAYGKARRAVGVANGTDALVLPLMAWGIKPGDAVFCPSFTFAATAQIIPWLGATPVFIDVEAETYNMSPAHLAAAIDMIKAEGRLTPKAVIAVDLFGQPANYPEIAAITEKHGLKLVADSAQGFGSTLNERHPVEWADVTTTSFFPAKPLGCYGDGGAVLTNDEALADLIDSLRVYGKVTPADLEGRSFDHDPKYMNMRIGMNSRLDTLQAAILLEKLAIFDEEIGMRDAVASRYNELLQDHVMSVPVIIEGGTSIWAQYTIEHHNRDGLMAHLKGQGIPSAVYYPIPMHKQTIFANAPQGPGGLPVTEAKSAHVISLPMHPYLSHADQDLIVEAVLSFNG